jgi:hypothetical protein
MRIRSSFDIGSIRAPLARGRSGLALAALMAAPGAGCLDLEGPLDEEVEVVPAALGSWSSQDIGAVAAAGSWTQSGSTHTVKGSGADIWGTADEFRYVFQSNIGDATIVARLASLTNTNSWTKAGLMMREDLTPGSKNVMVLATPTAANTYKMQYRTATGGTSTSVSSVAGTPPVWLKLERAGNTFKAFRSADGVTWSQIGTTLTMTMKASFYIGLAVTSHADGAVATGVFENVSMTGSPPIKLYLEAENGTLTAPMQVSADSTASGGNYIQVAAESNSTAAVPSTGHATWGFSVAEPGRHKIWGRVIAPTTNDDSFWVRVDTGAWIKWNAIPLGTSWHWAPVHNADAGNAVVEFNLAAGSHTLEIAYREDGTKLDRWFITSDVNATPSDTPRPAVRSVNPLDGATGVSTTAFISADLILTNVGGGVNINTMNASTVMLLRTTDGVAVPATRNTSGGGDVIVVQPSAPLDANTRYAFLVTDGLKDLTGASFLPFSSSFTTGTGAPPPPSTAAFDKIALTTASGRDFTSLTIGPDGKLYAGTLTGEIVRFPLAADGVTGTAEVLSSIRSANGGAARAIIGLTFDPTATATNLILWVTHGPAALTNAPDWSGKLSKLTGSTLGTVKDILVNLPRSIKDHMSNSIAFKPGENGVLYIAQGSMTAMGAPDNAWGQRTEHLLAGAVLRLDTAKLPATLPLNVQTNDGSPTTSGYNPFATNAPLTIYATGVRNAYDLVWHSNGSLYVPTNGSAAGGATPATPSPLPSACTRRIDDATRGDYTGPSVPGIANVTVAMPDFLFRVVQGGYYGHPNPFRCEWVMNGGNPTSGTDSAEVAQYPAGTQPDRNYRGFAYNFGLHYSPNGVVEWKSTNKASALAGKLLVARYSGGDDIIALTINSTTKDISGAEVGIVGFTGFSDPLDLVEYVGRAHLYVSELAGKRITLLRAR